MRLPDTRLHTLVAVVFASIVVTVVGGLVAVTDRRMTALSSVEADERFDALASDVSQRMRANFDPGLATLDAVAAMPLGRMEPLAAAGVVGAVMRAGENRSSTVTAVQIGRSDGSAVIVVRLDEVQRRERGADYATKIVDAGAGGLVQRTYFYDEGGHELYHSDAMPSDFDARDRPWYGAALAGDAAIVTRPYRYIGQHDVVGLTVARRSTADAGVVFGIDITPEGLSEALAALKRSSGANLLVFDPEGRFVVGSEAATSDDAAGGPPSATEEHSALQRALFRDYRDHGIARTRALSVDGGRFFVRYEGSVQVPGLIVAVSLPEAVVLGPAAALRDEQLLIGFGAVGAALLGSVLAARGLTRPLVVVTRRISAISAFEFVGARVPSSPIREVRDLWSMVRLLEHTLRTFARYVPDHLVQAVARDRVAPEVGGVRRSVTVLFTDVEDFTAISERESPQDMMRQISAYFGTISAVVASSGGFIDKYMGDSVMAVWISSSTHPDHVTRACAATREIARRVEKLNERFVSDGRPVLRTRYGLNTGEAIVGHVGSADRMSYTVIGHTVNLASRLEQQNKVCGTTVLASSCSTPWRD